MNEEWELDGVLLYLKNMLDIFLGYFPKEFFPRGNFPIVQFP